MKTIYGGYADSSEGNAAAKNNVVNLNGIDAFTTYGGLANTNKDAGETVAENNVVKMTNGNLSNLYGGVAMGNNATAKSVGNRVEVSGGKPKFVAGGYVMREGASISPLHYVAGMEGKGNEVLVTGGQLIGVAGGQINMLRDGSAKAEYNKVKVEKGEAALSVENLYGGWIFVRPKGEVSASHNEVEVKDDENFRFDSVNGGYVSVREGNQLIPKITLNDNVVKVQDAEGSVKGAFVTSGSYLATKDIKIKEVEANGNRVEVVNTKGSVSGVTMSGSISKGTMKDNIVKITNSSVKSDGVYVSSICDDLQSFELNNNKLTYDAGESNNYVRTVKGVSANFSGKGTAQIKVEDNAVHYINGQVSELFGVSVYSVGAEDKAVDGNISIRNNNLDLSGGETTFLATTVYTEQYDYRYHHSENLEVKVVNNTLRVTCGVHRYLSAVRSMLAPNPKYEVAGNKVILKGGKIRDNVNYLRNSRSRKDNPVTVRDNYVLIDGTSGNLDLTEADLAGIAGDDFALTPAGYSGNALEVKAFNGKVRSLSMRGFNEVIFDVTDASTDAPILEVTGGDNPNATDFQGVKVTARDLSGDTDKKQYVLLKNSAKIENVAKENLGKHLISGTLTTERYGLISLSEDNTELRLLAGVAGDGDEPAVIVSAPITAAQYWGASLGSLLEGDELIMRSLNDLAALDDGEYGAFAAVRYGKSDYDVLDATVSGTKLLAGAGKATEHEKGKLAYGFFFEMGNNDFDHTSYRDTAIYSDIDSKYYGIGAEARLERGAMYYDAALRFGRVKSEVMSKVVGGMHLYDYETDSNYFGAQLQVGQVRDMGDYDLDLYGRYSFVRVGSDNLVVGDEAVHFDSVNSHRLRLGARANFTRESAWTFYAGAAYEHEFSGTVDVIANGMKASADLDGGTFIGELGADYATDGPWEFRLNLEGFAGNREGFGASARAIYRF